jgi:hypothetical protein
MFFPVFGFGHLALSRAYKVEFIDEAGIWQEVIIISSYINKSEDVMPQINLSEEVISFVDASVSFDGSLALNTNIDANIDRNREVESYITRQYIKEVEL